MKKIDPVAMKETMRILIGSIVLGAITERRVFDAPLLEISPGPFGTLARNSRFGAQLFSYGANRFPQRDPSAG